MPSKKKKEDVVDYNNRPRLAQQYLLSHLPYFSDTLLCLSGPSDSFNNIVYAVTIMAHKYQKPFIVDAVEAIKMMVII